MRPPRPLLPLPRQARFAQRACFSTSSATAAAAASTPDYYATLGVARSATKKEIKASFYELSKRYHPDVTRGDAALKDKYLAISSAYTTLSDDAMRSSYDRTLAQASASPFGPYSGSTASATSDFTSHPRSPFYRSGAGGGPSGPRVRLSTSWNHPMHRDPFSQRWQQQQQQQDQRSDPFNSSFPFGGDPFSESQWSRPAPGQGGFPPGYDPQQANDWLWTSEARRDYEARRARASEKMLNKIRLRLMVYVLFIAFIATAEDRERKARVEQYVKEYNDNERQSKENG